MPYANSRSGQKKSPSPSIYSNPSAAGHEMLLTYGLDPSHPYAVNNSGSAPHNDHPQSASRSSSHSPVTPSAPQQPQQATPAMGPHQNHSPLPPAPQQQPVQIGNELPESFYVPLQAPTSASRHVLMTYQMQLMQLERENKARMLRAQQEQAEQAKHRHQRGPNTN